MCNCGCNTCDNKKSTLILNESLAPRAILSRGLKYHIDNKKPLTEHLYRRGSHSHFNLISEARSLYSRGILELTNKRDIELLTETDLGHFGMFEGKKVPLDFPMLNEGSEEDEIAQAEFGMDYDQLGPGEKEWVRDEIDNMSMNEVTRYSGFDRNPEDPDSIPFEPTGSVSEFKEDLRALFGKFKGDLKNPKFIKGVAQIMVNWKSLLRSQLDEGTSSVNENKNPYKKGDKVKYQLTFRGGVGKYADAISKSKEIKTGVIKKRIKTLSSFKYELTNGLEINPSEIIGLAEQVSEAREYKKGDKLKVKLKNGKEFEVTFDSYSSNKGIAFGRIDGDKKPFSLDAVVNEAKKKKKDPPIGKPKRSSSGGKAYKVFVRDPKTKNVKTIRFGSGGLRAKIKNPKARNAFSKRHDCPNKKDRMKASYWSCNLPRYAPALGLGPKMNTFW